MAVVAAMHCVTVPGALATGATPIESPVPQYFPPVEHLPLDPPLRLTGTFGEYRQGHFHAGLDFSTGEVVGKPVYAALSGAIVRLRASGAGYGRSIYLLADDGRLLVYGHLDGYDEPLASYVAAVQESSGNYEQDLWPDTTRFRVRAGQRLGWSGRSGTGPPHLHFEIRRGDVAYNPLLAGITVEDTIAPRITRVTLEPLDRKSAVEHQHGPVTKTFDSSASFGMGLSSQARLIVEAVDARANGRWTMAPWSIELVSDRRVDSQRVECRFDSVSWAEGMSEVDYVYDRGRTTPDGQYAVMLWAPTGFRSRVIRTLPPSGDVGGVGMVIANGSEQERERYRVVVRDANGNATSGDLVLIPEQDTPSRPLSNRTAVGKPGTEWRGEQGDFRWTIPGNAWFEPSTIEIIPTERPKSAPGLRLASAVFALAPALTPLRVPLSASIDVKKRRAPDHVGLYRDSGDGWELVGASFDASSHSIGGSTRQLGRFALFRDDDAPRITIATPPRSTPPTLYPTWAIEATLAESGSGVDRGKSWLVVDGKRVPSEWDGEKNTLRWTPLHAPGKGKHRVDVVATDRAGNVGRRRGTFVLD